MGALTLKSFPFELRGWDIEKFESLDPTDGFGSNTRAYVIKNQIIQIEPVYNTHTFNTWLTDKGRQFFDSIFQQYASYDNENFTDTSRNSFLNTIINTAYVFDHCNKQNSQSYFFTIAFNNLSLEMLNILILISQKYSFIKLRKLEAPKVNLDFESEFQLNNMHKLNSSNICLLLSTNTKYEGSQLNLRLRQRFLKGNFKCISISPLMNLTFPTIFLGSSISTLTSIVEGNHFICQDLKLSKNPFLIYNSELLQKNNGESLREKIKLLCNMHPFLNKNWNGLNVLNSGLSDTGSFTLTNAPKLTLTDYNNSSAFYFINTTVTSNIPNLKRIVELKLLKSFCTNNQFFFDQNYKQNSNIEFSNKLSTNYLHTSTATFFENEESFINTEGFLKRTIKLIRKQETKNGWQILRKILKQLQFKISFLNKKDNQIIFFNSKSFYRFKNLISFQYHATQSLTNLNFYLKIKNKIVIFHNFVKTFKLSSKKTFNTKLNLWLNDFYTGGKDEYSQTSLILGNSSKILRAESTNFF